MKKILIILVLFAASGTMTAQAQYREIETIFGGNDGSIQRDERGEYRWEMRERRVWVPEYRTRGVLGVGSRTIPGHYEMRRERVKVYLNQGKKNKKGHPHGMPPGQRKKMGERYDDRYEDRDRGYDSRRDRDDDDRRDRDDDDDDRRDRRYDDRRDRNGRRY